MKLAIGVVCFVVGGLVCAYGWIMNSDTPAPVGPVPVIGGFVLALIGFVLFLSAL